MSQGLQGNQGRSARHSGNTGTSRSNQGLQGLQGNSRARTQGLQGNQGLQGLQGNFKEGTQVIKSKVSKVCLQGNQGVQGNQGTSRRTRTQGLQGRLTGAFGGATFTYGFLTNTTNSDPGTGNVKFNNANLSIATTVYIDDEDDNSTDIQSYLRTIDDSTSGIKGHFKIADLANPDDFALFTITASSTEETGYFSIPVAYVSGSATSFSNGENLTITFARTGDKGDTGIQVSRVSCRVLQGNQVQGLQGLSNQGVYKVTKVLRVYKVSKVFRSTQGLQGNQGTQGTQGQGLQGNQGTQGLQGTQGNQGTSGSARKSGSSRSTGTPR